MIRHRRILALCTILVMLTSSSVTSTESSRKTSNSSSQIEALVKQLAESTALLEQLAFILRQERARWKRIHTNPVPDKVTCTYNDDNSVLTISVTIDTGVSNVINNQPIQRTYTVHAAEPKTRILPTPFIVLAGASFSAQSGLRPLIGVGIVDIPYIAKIDQSLSRVVVFGYTSGYSVGVGAGYVASKDYRIVCSLQTGAEVLTGVVAVSVGVSFFL